MPCALHIKFLGTERKDYHIRPHGDNSSHIARPVVFANESPPFAAGKGNPLRGGGGNTMPERLKGWLSLSVWSQRATEDSPRRSCRPRAMGSCISTGQQGALTSRCSPRPNVTACWIWPQPPRSRST